MYIKRHILAKLLDDLKEKYVTILVGARQVGKTFLLKKIEAEAKSQNLRTAFFDLEQPETLSKFNLTDAEIVVMLAEAGDVVFIDEFHYLKNASRIFKALYDKGAKVKIFASGSSSLEIHKHLKESLVGRKMVFQIPPCSLAEIGQAAKEEAFSYYCRFGGLPGLIHFEDEEKKRRLLADILQSYLLKDIKSLIKEENIRAFNNLLYLLAQSQGSITSTASLANEVGLTARTIEAYLELLAQTYVNHPLHSFSLNYGNELKKSKKYYLFDLGLRNVLLKNFAALRDRQDAGVVIESFVFLELQKLLSPETELRFWRLKDGTEVDFIWVKNQEPYPIEVKMSSRPGEIPDGIRAFLNKYPKAKKAFVVGRNNEGQVRYRDTAVHFVKLEDACLIPERI